MKGIVDLINDALARDDYPSAHSLVQQLQQREPDNPWLSYYLVLLEETQGEQDTAYRKYQRLLKEIINPKILAKIRQKITNIEDKRKQLQQLAINQAKTGNQESAILIIEPVDPAHKTQAVQQFAEIMQIDSYTARLQLPSRYWRLHRTGPLGELEFYQKALVQAQIPAFCVGIGAVNQVQVYCVKFIETETPQPSIQYTTSKGENATFSFDWQEVQQITRGILPIFDEVAELKWQLLKAKTEKRSRIIDYIKICDLHLREHNLILRLVENTYQYSEGITLLDKTISHKTIREAWQKLMNLFEQRCPTAPILSDFNSFAETAMDFELIFKQVKSPNIGTGSKDTLWEIAFHLYSSLAFFRSYSKS